MVQLTSEKCNVAWFKLAEFVSRKEKERAFAIYRLMVHALQDNALAAQLEGDLMAAFKDQRAIEAYKRSIAQYEISGRLFEAALVSEQLIALIVIPSQELLMKLHGLYQLLGNQRALVRLERQLKRLYPLSAEGMTLQESLQNSI